MPEPTTAMMVAQSEVRNRLAAAMHRLFNDLKPFMRAYAETPEMQDMLPKLDLVWIGGVDGGPEVVIHNAIRSNPELWATSIPPGCGVVPLDELHRLIGANATKFLAMQGAAMVETYAARFRHDADRKRHLEH